MLQGILFTRFDIKLGPIAEAMFPENFINQATLFELSFRIWTGSGMLNLSEAKGFTYTFYDSVNFFGCTWFDEDEKIGNYGITAFFSKEDSEIIAPNSDSYKAIMEKASKKIVNGASISTTLKELFEETNAFMRQLAETPKAEVHVSVNDFKEIIKLLKEFVVVVDKVNDFNLRLVLKNILDTLSEKIILLGRKLLKEDELYSLMKMLLF